MRAGVVVIVEGVMVRFSVYVGVGRKVEVSIFIELFIKSYFIVNGGFVGFCGYIFFDQVIVGIYYYYKIFSWEGVYFFINFGSEGVYDVVVYEGVLDGVIIIGVVEVLVIVVYFYVVNFQV